MRWFNSHHIVELKRLDFTDEDIWYFDSRVMPALEFHLTSPTMKELKNEFNAIQVNLEKTLNSLDKLIRSEQYDNVEKQEIYKLILLEDMKLHNNENTIQKFLTAGHRLNTLLNEKVFPKLPKEKTTQKSASPYLIQIIHEGLIKIEKDFPPSRTNQFYTVACLCWDAMGRGEPEAAVKAYIKQIKSMT